MARDWKPDEVKTFDAEVKRMRDQFLHPMHRDQNTTEQTQSPPPTVKPDYRQGEQGDADDDQKLFGSHVESGRGKDDDLEPSELPHEHAEVEKAARREEGLARSGQAASPVRHETAQEHGEVLRRASNVLEEKL